MSVTEHIQGVVVLYNPEQGVIVNIHSYVDLLEVLYIVDNSEHIDPELLAQIKSIPKCIYINNGGNRGIAHALNTGARHALDAGVKWLLTMDQDSKFEGNNFLNLCEFTFTQDDKLIGLVSPLHKTKLSLELPNQVDEVLTTMTSGNLISLYAYQTIGGFDEDYFIDAVDWDYCLRLHLKGFKVLRLNGSSLQHNLGNITRHTAFSRKEVMVLNYNKVRRYYITRNKLVIISKYRKHFPDFCYAQFKSLFRDLRHIILYEQDKFQKLKYMLKGVADFLLKKRGKLA